MPPVLAQESFADMTFPLQGVDLLRAFYDQQALTTRTGTNVRAFEPSTLRARGGSRPGLAKFVNSQLPLTYSSGLRVIQDLNTVVSAAGTALLNNYAFTPPLIADPSDIGPPSSWPPGRNSRVPFWSFRYGGTPIPPQKNGKKTPEIVWANPATIYLGTALSATQLNATAVDPADHVTPVPGTFTYNPLSAAVLSLGLDQPLRASFVPTDMTTYNTPVNGLVHIDVLPIPSCTHVLAYVQSKVNGRPPTPSGWSNGHTEQTFTSSVTSGDLVLAIFTKHMVDADSTITVSDTLGTSFSELVHYVPFGSGILVSIWGGRASSSGSNTVTANYSFTSASASNHFSSLCIMEYSNPSTIAILDDYATVFDVATGSAVSTGTVPVHSLCEMILAVFTEIGNDFNAYTASNGGTRRVLFGPGVNSAVICVIELNAQLPPSGHVDATISLPSIYLAVGLGLNPGAN